MKIKNLNGTSDNQPPKGYNISNVPYLFDYISLRYNKTIMM